LFSDGAQTDAMHRNSMQSSDHRRLMSPEGRNRKPLHVGVPVAARLDGRALCPATARPSSEENHARKRFGTAPVGKEADPPCNSDPPPTHRVLEGDASRFPVPGYHASLAMRNNFTPAAPS
jgi:hypothetical protein